ncbi:hypothetical protein M4I32_09810 [Microbacterium sp. LRZ72]|uniref:hypothetical protein n=1 Tax=Microbacterium sp. LRZ72 TaxID=2942481 RepID=UPI0029B11D85|nr:hypothetical protein [Microbacterium sp. LRZ72]MDX2377093.1 hypothetical protein [Microbacterium sp. LRZ72]
MADRETQMPDEEKPEGDYLEQQRSDDDVDADREAPADAPGRLSAPTDANEADVLEQSREVPDDEERPID